MGEPALGVSGTNVSLHDRAFTIRTGTPPARRDRTFSGPPVGSVDSRPGSDARRKRTHHDCDRRAAAPAAAVRSGSGGGAGRSKSARPVRSAFSLPVKSLPGGQLLAAATRAPDAGLMLRRLGEARQASDFQRILRDSGANAIIPPCHHQRLLLPPSSFSGPSLDEMRTSTPTPYSLRSVSDAYEELFQRHLDCLQRALSREFSVERRRQATKRRPHEADESRQLDEELLRDDMTTGDETGEESQRLHDDMARLRLGGGGGGADVPEITLSGCCDEQRRGRQDSEQDERPPSSNGHHQPQQQQHFTLTVPSVDCDVESRPPSSAV